MRVSEPKRLATIETVSVPARGRDESSRNTSRQAHHKKGVWSGSHAQVCHCFLMVFYAKNDARSGEKLKIVANILTLEKAYGAITPCFL